MILDAPGIQGCAKYQESGIIRTGCARHPLMRHASCLHNCQKTVIIRCATHHMMRHASKGTFSTWLFRKQLSLDAPRITWCAAHRVKWVAGNALNDKPYYDAPRITWCAAHRNLALSEYKADRGELFSLSLSHFSTSHRQTELVQSAVCTIFRTFERDSSCSSSFFFIGVDLLLIIGGIWSLRDDGFEISSETSLLRVFHSFYSSFLANLWILLI